MQDTCNRWIYLEANIGLLQLSPNTALGQKRLESTMVVARINHVQDYDFANMGFYLYINYVNFNFILQKNL